MAVRFLTQQPETAKPIARSKMDSTSYLDFLNLQRVLLVGKSFLCMEAGFWGIQNTLPISGLYQSYGSTFAWILTWSGCVLDRFRPASVPAGTACLQQGWAQQINVDPDRRFSSKKSLILQLYRIFINSKYECETPSLSETYNYQLSIQDHFGSFWDWGSFPLKDLCTARLHWSISPAFVVEALGLQRTTAVDLSNDPKPRWSHLTNLTNKKRWKNGWPKVMANAKLETFCWI